MRYGESYERERDFKRLSELLGAGRPAVKASHAGVRQNSDGVQLETSKMMKNNKGQIARSVRFDIATDKNEEFHTLFRNEILPTLKKQEGFKDELLLVKDQHVLAISVWNNVDSARKYETTAYPQLDKKLRPVMSGNPTVETFKYDSLSTIA
jgi:hypothetical protein